MKAKILFCTILAMLSLLAISGTAVFADVIAEPANQFYWDNPADCDYNKWRPFEVLEDSDLLESPLDSKTNGSVKAGETVQVGFTYTDDKGVVWGCCSFSNYGEEGGRNDGWVEMSKLKEIFNVFTFLDEHESEMIDYNGEIDDYIPKERIVLWEYPFGNACGVIDADKWYTKETYPYMNDIAEKCWTDENGNLWIYDGKWVAKDFSQYSNCWVFFPAPEEGDLTVFGYDISANEGAVVSGQLFSEEETEAAYNAAVKSLNSGRRSAYTLPVCLSLGAVVISAAMIKLMKKKN